MLLSFQIACSQEPPVIPTHLCPGLQDLTARCLQLTPDSRPQARELVHHPVFAELFHWWSHTVLFYTTTYLLNYLFITLPTAEILSCKNARAFLVCGFLMKSNQRNILKIWRKSLEPFGSYLLNSAANPAHFHLNLAGLAVLFSRQVLNGSQGFFCFNIFIFIHLFKYKTIETHASEFLPPNFQL